MFGKRLVLALVTVFMAALVIVPASPVAAAGTPGDPVITSDACTITVKFDADVAGTYTVEIWDDFVLVYNQSVPAAAGDTLIFEATLKYVGTVVPGVGIYVYRDGGLTFAVDPYTAIDTSCAGPGGCSPTIPSGSVVGQITSPTVAYWAPGLEYPVQPDLVLGTTPDTKTWWVIGMDSTASWYKILVSCQYVWVPASSMGPNYDDVWQGEPLPTRVVKN
jgi:hypothetical protein